MAFPSFQKCGFKKVEGVPETIVGMMDASITRSLGIPQTCIVRSQTMVHIENNHIFENNKTENPSKDALDKADNYAKCKLCQL